MVLMNEGKLSRLRLVERQEVLDPRLDVADFGLNLQFFVAAEVRYLDMGSREYR